MNIKKELANFAGVKEEQILISPKLEMGDFCLPCFEFAKQQHKTPQIIANDLKEKLSLIKNNLVEKIEVMGGYLNFFLNKTYIAKIVLKTNTYDFSLKNYGKGKTVCIDYCSTNLAKYLHIGHMSTTVIGESLHRLHKALGYKVVRINYLGDYGTPFGKMVVAIQLWGDLKNIEEKGIDAIQDLYVRFSQNETEELMNKARFASKQIEDKVGEEYEIYKTIIGISIKECKRIINLMGLEFDDWRGESFYNNAIAPMLEELQNKNILKQGEGNYKGTQVVDLSSENLGLVVVKRSDGGSVYAVRDLCALVDRNNLYKFDEMLYVVAVQQQLYFKQLFAINKLLNRPFANKLKHISFGMFSTPEGKIASRRGKQALFVDMFQTAYDKALNIIKNKEFKIENQENVAKKVAIGSIAFSILKVERNKDKIFDLEKAISFDGETAPYLQYTYARTCALERKFKNLFKNYKGSNKTNFNNSNNSNFISVIDTIYNKNFEIFNIINNFENVVLEAKLKYEPSLIAKILLDLAQAFNKFYNEEKIIYEYDYNLSSELMKIVLKVKSFLEFALPLVMVEPIVEM